MVRVRRRGRKNKLNTCCKRAQRATIRNIGPHGWHPDITGTFNGKAMTIQVARREALLRRKIDRQQAKREALKKRRSGD